MKIKRSTAFWAANLATSGFACTDADAQSAPTRNAIEVAGVDGGPLMWVLAVLASAMWLTLVASVLGRPAPPRRILRSTESLAADEQERELGRAGAA